MPRTPSNSLSTPALPARVKIIEAITAPLGFYVLALLIVESFLAIVLIHANISPQDQIRCVYIATSLFVFVVVIVSVLVWNRPWNLTFDKAAHLADRARTPYGSDQERVSPRKLFASSKQEEAP